MQLTLQDIQHQISLAELPTNLGVTAQIEGSSVRLSATQDGGALELLVTEGAMKMYGEGPSISMALTELKKAAAQGLPQQGAGQQATEVLLGD